MQEETKQEEQSDFMQGVACGGLRDCHRACKAAFLFSFCLWYYPASKGPVSIEAGSLLCGKLFSLHHLCGKIVLKRGYLHG